MALGTVTQVAKGVLAPGGLRYCIFEVAPSAGANYTANGEAIALSNFPKFRKEVLFASVEPVDETSGTVYRYVLDLSDPAEPVLVVVVDDGTSGVPAEAAGNTDLSGKTVRIFAIGH